ncbi:hypothetical protein H477_4184 [[Clostridium] sordellii ATCC 9714]|nr:hypothetical protein H477_4184 [[Clostridium] sordellii ATCC 9714] [Paeniclostridium sordellii ATCC 9714]
MKLKLDIYDSSFKHVKNNKTISYKTISNLCVAKEEAFAFQVMLNSNDDFFVN